MSPIVVSGALFSAREEHLQAYSLHQGLGLYCSKNLSHYMPATYHPLLYLGPYSLRERNISKLICCIRDLAIIVTKCSSTHRTHYCIWGLIHCARGTSRRGHYCVECLFRCAIRTCQGLSRNITRLRPYIRLWKSLFARPFP